MKSLLPNLSKSDGLAPARRPVAAWRIRFASAPPADVQAWRQFAPPFATCAVRRAADPSELSEPACDGEPFDELLVIVSDCGAAPERDASDQWTAAPPDHPAAAGPLLVRCGSLARIRWRPGRAVIEAASPERAEELLAAVAEVACYEGELRRLERDLLEFEARAPADVPLSYRIRRGQRKHSNRILDTMHRLATLRLTFAKLKPHLLRPPPSLPPGGRRAMSRLLAAVGPPERLEAVNERLEACEELYEGAVDRINDFRWYYSGGIMEITIIVLLAAEALLMLWDIHLHHA